MDDVVTIGPSDPSDQSDSTCGFYAAWLFAGWFLQVPYWFPILVFATLATLPWLRWKFSLRTLLIATTLVAVGLGLIVRAALA